MKCLGYKTCNNVLLPHEGHSKNAYYWGYCEVCCEERRSASDAEDALFHQNVHQMIEAYIAYRAEKKVLGA